jgi:hypothetical protein
VFRAISPEGCEGVGQRSSGRRERASDEQRADEPVGHEVVTVREGLGGGEARPQAGPENVPGFDLAKGDRQIDRQDRRARRGESPEAIEAKERREGDGDRGVKAPGRASREDPHADGKADSARGRMLPERASP